MERLRIGDLSITEKLAKSDGMATYEPPEESKTARRKARKVSKKKVTNSDNESGE